MKGRFYGIKLIIVSLILIYVFPAVSMAQVEISGYVTDSIKRTPLYPATVFDKTLGIAAFTDSSGYFHIVVKGDDELYFSYLGYYTIRYKVPRNLTNIIYNVQMLSKNEKLNEVTVRSLTSYQRDSLDRARTFGNYLDKPDINTINKEAHSLHDKPNPNYNNGFGIELNPFSLFSKKRKDKRKFGNMYNKMEQQSFIASRYTPDLVHKLTGLKGDSLSWFLYHYQPSYRFARYATDLEFWSWIKMKYKTWTKPK